MPWRQALGTACIHNGRAVEAERGSNPEGGFLREQLSHVGGVGGAESPHLERPAVPSLCWISLAYLHPEPQIQRDPRRSPSKRHWV